MQEEEIKKESAQKKESPKEKREADNTPKRRGKSIF